MAALDGARVDLFLVTSPPTMLSQYPTALPTPDPSALPTPAPQTPSAAPTATPAPSTARPSTNDSRVWLDADGDDEPTPEEIAAALGYGSLIGAFLTVGFCFLFRRATAGLKIFPDEKELDFDAI